MPRGNADNLKPVQTNEEARERGRRGGIRSGEVRRQRRTLREELLALLQTGDIQQQMTLALVNEALNGNAAGSVTKAFEVVRDTVGEKPVEKVMVAEVEQAVIDEVENAVLQEVEDE